MSTSFTSVPNPANPAAGQGPFPEWILNPLGSQFAAQYGHPTTGLIDRAVKDIIIESIPKKWGLLKLLLSRPTQYKPNTEWSWYEKLYQRPILTAAAGSGGNAQGRTVELTADGITHVSLNLLVTYGNNQQGIITNINTATRVITITPENNSAGIDAIAQGDLIMVTAPIIADGMNHFVHYDRSTVVEYSNVMAQGQRNRRWTTIEALKHKNLGRTDYYEKDMKDLLEECYRDMFALYVNGQYGEYDISAVAGTGLTPGTYKAKVGDGFYPFMRKYGAMSAVSNEVTLVEDFKTLAFATDYMAENEPRWVLGTARTLHRMSEVWKDPVQYAPNDTVASLDLQVYGFGGMKYVPMVVPQFESAMGLLPGFEDKLIVINPESITPTCLTGMETIKTNNTANQHKQFGGYLDYIDTFAYYMIGMEMNTVGGSFWIDVI